MVQVWLGIKVVSSKFITIYSNAANIINYVVKVMVLFLHGEAGSKLLIFAMYIAS